MRSASGGPALPERDERPAAGTAAPPGEAATIERRLRRLSSACAAPAAAALVAAAAIVWKASKDAAEGWLGSPPSRSFLVALGALLLILLSGAAHARILRPVRQPESDPEPSGDAPGWAERVRLYSQATAVSFAMLAVAVGLGAAVGLAGRAPFYGLVICLASLLGMIVRWPRQAALEAAVEEGAAGPRR
jgi:hypothetical protein